MAADRGAAAPGGAGPCVGPGGERAARAHQHNLFLFLFFLVVVNPTAFHNKSQIINKCVPLMTGLFNSKNWKMLRQFFFFFFSLSPPGAALSQSVRVAEPAEATAPLLRKMLELLSAIPIGCTACQGPLLLMSPRSASGAFLLLGKPGEAPAKHSGGRFCG